jgi:hypothetical protein
VGKPNGLGLQLGDPECANGLHYIPGNRVQQIAACHCFLDLFVALWRRAEHVNIHDPVETTQNWHDPAQVVLIANLRVEAPKRCQKETLRLSRLIYSNSR